MKRRTFLAQGAGVGLAAVVSPAAIGATAASPLIVGQSAALTGPQSGFGIAIRDGLEAALASINRNGDVYGRPVQLVSLDDQGDKAKTEANVAQLAANPRVVGLTGFTTRPCSEAGAVLAAKEGIALVGAFSGTPLLYGEREPRGVHRRHVARRQSRPGLHQPALQQERAVRLALRRPVAGLAQRGPGVKEGP